MKIKYLYDKNNQIAQKKANELKKLLLKFNTNNANNKKFVFLIGGDGFFLKQAQNYLKEPNTRLIFINAGTLGFYSYTDNIKSLNIDDLFNEDNYESLDLLEVSLANKKLYSINDCVINSSAYAINLDIKINNVLLQSIKANGILITTPMGSTARSKSLGGAILMPNLPIISITEIEPIHNRHYSSLGSGLVIDNKDKILITAYNYKKSLMVNVDGNVNKISKDKLDINISHTKSKAKLLIKTDTLNWIKKLNHSFNNQ